MISRIDLGFYVSFEMTVKSTLLKRVLINPFAARSVDVQKKPNSAKENEIEEVSSHFWHTTVNSYIRVCSCSQPLANLFKR